MNEATMHHRSSHEAGDRSKAETEKKSKSNGSPRGEKETRRTEESRRAAETKRRRGKELERQEVRDKQKIAEETIREAKKRIEEAIKDRKQEKIVFKEAKDSLKVISALQDEKPVIIDPGDLKSFKDQLEKYGHLKAFEIAHLAPEQIVVVYQAIARKAGIEAPESKDFAHKGGKHKVLDKQYAESLIEQATKSDEETLTVEKVGDLLEIVGVSMKTSEGKQGGPGTLESVQPEEEEEEKEIKGESIPVVFKQLLLEKWQILKQPESQQDQQRLQDLEAEIQTRVHSNNPWLVGNAVRDLKEVLLSIKHEPQLKNDFNENVLTLNSQNEIIKANQDLDGKYENLMRPLAGDARFNDICQEANIVLSGLSSGWINRDRAEAQLYNKAISSRDIPGMEGLRLWFARKQLESALMSSEIIQRTRVQADPHANMRAAEETMLFFEQSQSVEGFTLARQRLSDLRFAVEQSNDPTVTQEMKDKLKRRIDAFEVITPIFITMHQSEGDPEAMQRAVSPLSNETFFNYLDRFSDLRDPDGNPYLKYTDANGNEKVANFVSEAIKAFTEEYQLDRHRKNLVETMTRRDLNINSDNADEQWLIKHLLNLPQNQPLPHLTLVQINQLRNSWNEDATKIHAVNEWYAHQTLIGVDGFAPDSSEELRDVKENELMHTRLRNRLLALRVLQANVDALLDNYVLTQAAKSVAANFVRFSAASALDRLRVYNSKGELTSSLFGEETPFYAREIDQMPDYFLSEHHGDPNVNRVIREAIDERWRTFFLAPNQVLYRIIDQFKNRNMLPPDMAQNIENEQQAELNQVIARTGLENLQRPEVDAYVIMDMIYRFDPNNPNDPTTIDLSRIDWIEASKELDSYTFNDNANDRTQTIKWFRGRYKAFTFQPFDKQMFEMLDEYYSSRHIRKRQAMDFFLDIYWEAGHHWKDWLDYKDNITDVVMEGTIQQAIEHNVLDKPRAERKKNVLLGNPSFRYVKQMGILGIESIKDLLRPGSLFGGFLDFWKTLFAYLTQTK